MKLTRGKPYHPMTQGKVERWHLSLKSWIQLENYDLPGDRAFEVTGQIDFSAFQLTFVDNNDDAKSRPH